MKERRIILILLLYVLPFVMQAQKNETIRMVSESAVYISGDMVRLQLITLDEPGTPVNDDRIIHVYLVDNQGMILSKRKFLTTQLDKAGYIHLPEDLETGNYKLAACLPGRTTRTELILHVYNPNIFSSSIAPKNADVNKSLSTDLNAETLTVSGNNVIGQQETAIINGSDIASEGIMLTKIFDPRNETPPVTGSLVKEAVPERIEDEISFDFISTDPNARISLYFIEQGFVEEFYVAEKEKMERKLPTHFGSGHVYAYQFGPQGNRLGELSSTINRAGTISFASFTNTVPFDEKVLTILEKKRIRKYVKQVYQTAQETVTSLMEDEYDMKPDREVEVADFNGVATLREALSNITPKTQVIKRNKTYELRLSPESSGYRYPDKPLILVNGLPTYEADSLMNIPASEVEKIEVFISQEKLRRFGTFGRYGVLSVILKSSAVNPLQEKLESWPMYYGVSDLIAQNDIPKEGPDLRPVLNWEPTKRVNGNNSLSISWHNSDVAGPYIIWTDVIYQNGKTTREVYQMTVNAE